MKNLPVSEGSYQEEWHLIRWEESIHFLKSLQVKETGKQCFNKQLGERNSNTCQHRLNTPDSCPPGKFGVRVRTGRVKDQVAVTQTRQSLSSSLQGACLTEERKEWERETENQRENREMGGRETGRLTI